MRRARLRRAAVRRSASGGNPDWAPPLLRLGYGSFVTPGAVYDFDVATGELLLRKRQPVLGDYDPTDYAQRRDWATRRRRHAGADLARVEAPFGDAGTAPRPCYLYGYGSYEHSIEPGFSIARLSLLDRGVVFAVAHVRGGGEMGRHWYEDGKLLHKRNTFTDFVAVRAAPRRHRCHRRRTGWSPRAAARAGC